MKSLLPQIKCSLLLACLSLGLLSAGGWAQAQTPASMIDPATGQSYQRGTATYVPPGSYVNPGPITQSEIDVIADQTVKADAQWRLNQAHTFQTQSDGVERPTDKNQRGKERNYFSPQKLTAADCLIGRHWELTGGYAGCVCDGDLTHARVSNDVQNACVAAPPPIPTGPSVTSENQTLPCPPPMTGTMWQSRQVVTTNGVPAYGAWTPAGDTCAGSVVVAPPAGPPAAPVVYTAQENQVLACPVGYSGTGSVQTRMVTYTDGVPTAWGAWVLSAPDCHQAQPDDPMIRFYFAGGCGMDSAVFQIHQSKLTAYLDWSANIDGPQCFIDGNTGLLSYHGSVPTP